MQLQRFLTIFLSLRFITQAQHYTDSQRHVNSALRLEEPVGSDSQDWSESMQNPRMVRKHKGPEMLSQQIEVSPVAHLHRRGIWNGTLPETINPSARSGKDTTLQVVDGVVSQQNRISSSLLENLAVLKLTATAMSGGRHIWWGPFGAGTNPPAVKGGHPFSVEKDADWNGPDYQSIAPAPKWHEILMLLIATVFSIATLFVALKWLKQPVAEEPPDADSLEAPAVGTITSMAQIGGITSMNFAYGVAVCVMGVFLLPKEAETMFPNHPSIALGAFEALVASTMLVGPVAGRTSDSFKHPLGRRRPMIFAFTLGAGLVTALMWGFSMFHFRYLYIIALPLQQMMWNSVNAAQTALLADLVEPSRKDVASAIQTASLLSGAIASIVTFQFFARNEIDFRMNYLLMITMGSLMLPVLHISAKEQSSDQLTLAEPLNWAQPWQAFTSVFDLGDDRSPDFRLVTRERGVYYCGVASKAFVLFFLKDGVKIDSDEGQMVFMADVAMASACAATSAGLLTSLLFSVTKIRPQVVACIGAAQMAVCSQFWSVVFLGSVELRKTVMLCFITGYGAGQGAYLAADLALALGTMPDPNEASRYMGLWGLSAFVGGGLGSFCSAFLMEMFGRFIPEKCGVILETGSYWMGGYMALLIGTLCCNTYVAWICYHIRTREEYNNPQGGQDVETNPQDGS